MPVVAHIPAHIRCNHSIVAYQDYTYDLVMPNVLVVDGEPVTRDLIAGMLEEAGMTVQVAEAERDADRALDSGEFDVVVSAADPPRPALLNRHNRPTPPVIAVSGPTISCLPLLDAIRDLATR